MKLFIKLHMLPALSQGEGEVIIAFDAITKIVHSKNAGYTQVYLSLMPPLQFRADLRRNKNERINGGLTK